MNRNILILYLLQKFSFTGLVPVARLWQFQPSIPGKIESAGDVLGWWEMENVGHIYFPLLKEYPSIHPSSTMSGMLEPIPADIGQTKRIFFILLHLLDQLFPNIVVWVQQLYIPLYHTNQLW